jgi:iron complex outermembrane receptor protein
MLRQPIRKRTSYLLSATAGLPLLASLPAPAGESGTSAGTSLEEVVVTARRREESLQDVPISITALSTQDLERLQIHDLAQLQFVTPNLSVAPGQTSGASASIAIRGQYESDTTPTVDPAVGLYLDGVYFARMTGANLDMTDVERVEVLRGPQHHRGRDQSRPEAPNARIRGVVERRTRKLRPAEILRIRERPAVRWTYRHATDCNA